ncbi:MAG: C25 family cysteine peptidase [Planctomycetota bacterium]
MRAVEKSGIAVLAAVLACAAVAAADGWVAVGAASPVPAAPDVAVTQADAGALQVQVRTPGLDLATVTRAGRAFVELSWPDAQPFGEVGTPALPVVRRLFVAPRGAALVVTSAGPAGVEIPLHDLVLPAQPPIPKIPGALEQAVFQFDPAAYALDAELPAERVVVAELGIVRGQRLCMVEFRPVAYNPARGVLTVYPELTGKVDFIGGAAPAGRDAGPTDPFPGLQRLVLNPEALSGALDGGAGGNYLICVASTLESAIAGFANAKTAQGYTVTVHACAPGTTNTQLRTYIQSLWGTGNQPRYVLLVGDTDTIPHFVGQGSGSPDTDLYYACIDPNDWYPDLAIGRFPVRDPNDLAALVAKTLYYENGPLADPGYMKRAVFMASRDNYTVSEGTHNWVIDRYMTPNQITSDKLYCYTYNATTQQVTNSFNGGRFYGIYSGHGDNTYWADGPRFDQANVRALTNQNMYSFVCSFACLTGHFSLTECFMETWVRVADKGAATAWGSSVTSYWTEDDILEKRLFDVIYDANDPVPDELGPVLTETKLRYLAHFGPIATTRRYFEMYNLMGDPAFPMFGPITPPHGMQVQPFGGFTAAGQVGGPFTPGEMEYTITNHEEFPIQYAVTRTAPWLTLTNATGTIPGGQTVAMRVAINGQANYLGSGDYTDVLEFTNLTNHDGDTTRNVLLRVGVPTQQYFWNLDTNPGWTTQAQWAWGRPMGLGGDRGGPDPTAGYTGQNVYGYNLSGGYTNNMPEYSLTTAAIDCSRLTETSLRFRRWLGVEQNAYDHARVKISTNGTTWNTLWENPGTTLDDQTWTYQQYDIAAYADRQPTVYIRWTMGTTDGSLYWCGWNIDDIEIWGLEPGGAQYRRGDLNCDLVVNFDDINPFVLALTDPGAYQTQYPDCPILNGDCNGDGVVNFDDINPFVELLTGTD